jgi:hypothetical protein
MRRPDWLLVVLLSLLAFYAAAAIAIAVSAGGERQYGSGPKLHPPRSAEERRAAAAGIAHLGGGRAIDARVDGIRASVVVNLGGSIHFLGLAQQGRRWVVASDEVGGLV